MSIRSASPHQKPQIRHALYFAALVCAVGVSVRDWTGPIDWAHAAFAPDSAAFCSMDSASSAPSLVRLPPLPGPHPYWMCRHKSGWVQRQESSKRSRAETGNAIDTELSRRRRRRRRRRISTRTSLGRL